MSIMIGNYSFEGPFDNTAPIRNNSGVYAILSRRTDVDRYTVIDIGEAGWVQDRVANHDRRDQWRHNNHGTLAVATLYRDEAARMRIERELRAQFSPVCGVR